RANAGPVFWEKARAHLVRYGGEFAPFIAEPTQGSFMWDADGRRILDFCFGQMSAILGHSHPKIIEVVRRQWASSTISIRQFFLARSSVWPSSWRSWRRPEFTGGAASATYSSSRRGYGSAQIGSFVLPAPDSYRSGCTAADGTYDWRAERDFGFELIDRQKS